MRHQGTGMTETEAYLHQLTALQQQLASAQDEMAKRDAEILSLREAVHYLLGNSRSETWDGIVKLSLTTSDRGAKIMAVVEAAREADELFDVHWSGDMTAAWNALDKYTSLGKIVLPLEGYDCLKLGTAIVKKAL